MIMDYDSNKPIYLQIEDSLKVDIFSGKLSPGSRLPSIRELAVSMKANPNTIQRALADLEETGLIINEGTNGKSITENEHIIHKHRHRYARELTRIYKKKMREIGL